MNYYEILQISSNADEEVIKAAYKAMSKKYHPDVYKDGGEMMLKLNEAYAVLNNPKLRSEYDAMLNADNCVKNKKSENKIELGLFGKIIAFLIAIIELIVSGVIWVIEFAWGIILIIIIIGLFTGHTQQIMSNLIKFIF